MGNTGIWKVSDLEKEGSSTAAHEFGHLMGLDHSISSNKTSMRVIGKDQSSVIGANYIKAEKSIMIPKGAITFPEWRTNSESKLTFIGSKVVPNTYGKTLPTYIGGNEAKGSVLDESKRRAQSQDIENLNINENSKTLGGKSQKYHYEKDGR